MSNLIQSTRTKDTGDWKGRSYQQEMLPSEFPNTFGNIQNTPTPQLEGTGVTLSIGITRFLPEESPQMAESEVALAMETTWLLPEERGAVLYCIENLNNNVFFPFSEANETNEAKMGDRPRLEYIKDPKTGEVISIRSRASTSQADQRNRPPQTWPTPLSGIRRLGRRGEDKQPQVSALRFLEPSQQLLYSTAKAMVKGWARRYQQEDWR